MSSNYFRRDLYDTQLIEYLSLNSGSDSDSVPDLVSNTDDENSVDENIIHDTTNVITKLIESGQIKAVTHYFDEKYDITTKAVIYNLCNKMCGNSNANWLLCFPKIIKSICVKKLLHKIKDITPAELTILFKAFQSVTKYVTRISNFPTVKKFIEEKKISDPQCGIIQVLDTQDVLTKRHISFLFQCSTIGITKVFSYLDSVIAKPDIRKFMYTNYLAKLVHPIVARKFLSRCPQEYLKLKVYKWFETPGVFKEYLKFVKYVPQNMIRKLPGRHPEYLRHALNYGFDPTPIMNKLNESIYRYRYLELCIQKGFIPNFLPLAKLIDLAKDKPRGLVAIRNKFGNCSIKIPTEHYSWLKKCVPIAIPSPLVLMIYEFSV